MVRSTRITLRLPLTQYKSLYDRAQEKNKSLSEIIRDSLDTSGIKAKKIKQYDKIVGYHVNKPFRKNPDKYDNNQVYSDYPTTLST